MSKKLSNIEKIEQELERHLFEMEALFPMEMRLSIIGRDVAGQGCEFVIGEHSPEELIGILERTESRIAEGEKEKAKPAKKQPKKVSKAVKKKV